MASRSRDCAGTSSSRPGDKAIGYAVGWHERPARLTVLVPARLWPRLAYRQFRQHTLCVRSAPASLHYFILIALTLLTREPLQRGIKLRTMWRCLFCRCVTVTLTADPHLAFVRAVSAPACRHPSRQPTAPPEKDQPGLLTPSPRPSPMLDPFRPQGVVAGN